MSPITIKRASVSPPTVGVLKLIRSAAIPETLTRVKVSVCNANIISFHVAPESKDTSMFGFVPAEQFAIDDDISVVEKFDVKDKSAAGHIGDDVVVAINND